MEIDGFEYYLGGKSTNQFYLKNAMPLYLPDNDEEYFRKIMKAIEIDDYKEVGKNGKAVITKENNMILFDTLSAKLKSEPYIHNRCNIYKILEGKEKIFKDKLLSLNFINNDSYYVFNGSDEELFNFLDIEIMNLKSLGEVYYSDKFKNRNIINNIITINNTYILLIKEGNFSINLLRNIFSIIRRIPNNNPHIKKVQLAPCQIPVNNHTI